MEETARSKIPKRSSTAPDSAEALMDEDDDAGPPSPERTAASASGQQAHGAQHVTHSALDEIMQTLRTELKVTVQQANDEIGEKMFARVFAAV